MELILKILLKPYYCLFIEVLLKSICWLYILLLCQILLWILIFSNWESFRSPMNRVISYVNKDNDFLLFPFVSPWFLFPIWWFCNFQNCSEQQWWGYTHICIYIIFWSLIFLETLPVIPHSICLWLWFCHILPWLFWDILLQYPIYLRLLSWKDIVL